MSLEGLIWGGSNIWLFLLSAMRPYAVPMWITYHTYVYSKFKSNSKSLNKYRLFMKIKVDLVSLKCKLKIYERTDIVVENHIKLFGFQHDSKISILQIFSSSNIMLLLFLTLYVPFLFLRQLIHAIAIQCFSYLLWVLDAKC